jgi:acylphosphatase
MERIHARVEGRVQGVGFRFYAAERARQLGLSGWVRNLPDGSVEVEAQGPSRGVRDFVEFLEVGPSSARVSAVRLNPCGVEADDSGFRIL